MSEQEKFNELEEKRLFLSMIMENFTSMKCLTSGFQEVTEILIKQGQIPLVFMSLFDQQNACIQRTEKIFREVVALYDGDSATGIDFSKPPAAGGENKNPPQ